jgi:hypothetical protein
LVPIEFRQALDFFLANHKEFIIGIDTNAHSQIWGYDNSDTRGEIFEDLIIAYNLCPLNSGDTPTFYTQHGKSIIDVTLCSPNIHKFCSNWRVSTEHIASDHRLISLDIQIEKPLPELKQNLAKCNWTLVRDRLSQLPIVNHTLWSEEIIELETKFITTFITDIVDNVCPPRPQKYKINLTHWNENLTMTRRAMRKAWHRLQKNDTPQNWADYNKLRNIHKKSSQES